MITDEKAAIINKLYGSLNEDILNRSVGFKIGSKYYFAEFSEIAPESYRFKRNIWSFKLNVPNRAHINVPNVGDYTIITKRDKPTKWQDPEEYSVYYNYNYPIIDETDDFYLLIYSLSDKCEDTVILDYDILIYHNYKFLYKIEYSLGLTMAKNYPFDVSNIYFDRRFKGGSNSVTDKWQLVNGNEIHIGSASVHTFYNWCKENNRLDVIKMYSSKYNEFPVKSPLLILENSPTIWFRCPVCGESWGQGIDLKGIFKLSCPNCEEKQAERLREEVGKPLLNLLKNYIDIWENKVMVDTTQISEFPDSIEIWFLNQYKKRHYIALEYAKKEQCFQEIEDNVYYVQYNKYRVEDIAFLYECLTYYSEANYELEEESLSKAKTFLETCHIPNIIRSLYYKCIEADCREDPVCINAEKIIHQYVDMQKEQWEIIYQEIVARGDNIVKWKSEQNLFTLVKKKYTDAIFQYKGTWLGMQSLDIFVPCLNLAFEYQGQQHYEPVDFFGGENALEQRKSLDERKKNLCTENGVILIEWPWTDEISEPVLNQKLLEHNIK